jgi:predicted small lipoprotein YifL
MSNHSARRSAGRAAVAIISIAAAVVGCGQKGPLFLPDEATEVVTRPTQTPPAAPPESSTPPAATPTPDAPPEKRKEEASAPPATPGG